VEWIVAGVKRVRDVSARHEDVPDADRALDPGEHPVLRQVGVGDDHDPIAQLDADGAAVLVSVCG
jgi:hypothetical protein